MPSSFYALIDKGHIHVLTPGITWETTHRQISLRTFSVDFWAKYYCNMFPGSNTKKILKNNNLAYMDI